MNARLVIVQFISPVKQSQHGGQTGATYCAQQYVASECCDHLAWARDWYCHAASVRIRNNSQRAVLKFEVTLTFLA